MHHHLNIRPELWPEITDQPHFVIDLEYAGCTLHFDDIYFDNIEETCARLRQLARERQGSALLDGGFRFSLAIEIMPRGDIKLAFHAESEPPFPGKLSLDGFFQRDGEYASSLLQDILDLLKYGKELSL